MAPDLVPTATKSVTGFTKSVTIPKRAYVTFLAGNGDYAKGVIGLAKGLRKVKTAYPLVVAVLPDVPEEHREMLESQGCIVREIEPVYPPENQTQFAMAYYVINYSKLRIWEVYYTYCTYTILFPYSVILHVINYISLCCYITRGFLVGQFLHVDP
jgi:inositol 3-alpha-galactosyltransferase